MEMEIVSYIFSFASIAFYSVVYLPQFREIYKTKDTSGISFIMLLLWTQSDYLSLIGTILNDLNLSVIILGWYHTFMGLAMVSFVLYYKSKFGSKNQFKKSLAPIIDTWAINTFVKDIFGIWYKFMYCLLFFGINISVAAGLYYYRIVNLRLGDILGWITMALYITGRFPQIILNYNRKSTQGLSILMYILTICGNTCYVMSLLFWSIEPEYIRTNTPWIISSVVTILLDFFVIWQYFVFRIPNDILPI